MHYALQAFRAFALAGLIVTTLAQEISIPDPGLNFAVRDALNKPVGPLTQEELLGLTGLFAISRNIQNLQGLSAAHNLKTLILDDNNITDLSAPNELTTLSALKSIDLSENPLTSLTLPDALTNLIGLRVELGALTNLTLPASLPKMTDLRLGFNQLRALALPADMINLSIVSIYLNQLTNLTLPPILPNLSQLFLDGNRLSQLLLPAGLTKLEALVLSANQLTNFNLPPDATNLRFLRLNDNQLTNLTLPAGLNQLSLLFLSGNQLHSLTLPTGMTNLNTLILDTNQLTSLTLPPDLTNLTTLSVAANPLTSLVLPEPLAAATNLAAMIATLRDQGVSVFTYPLAISVLSTHRTDTAFEFTLTGPPGVYSILTSTNLTAWTPLVAATNQTGTATFTDLQADPASQKYYSAIRQIPPTNMIYVAPNTFVMGSPPTDFDRSQDEFPQTTVTLTHGYWISTYEVTQGEYLDIMGTNPSNFPGDLRRAVSSVNWPDATNYCAKLTQRELAAGRISPGCKYRLPTEAEWECAARAGTTTRFSYGDDLNYVNFDHYAWRLIFNNDLAVHPVGEKIPNPWGLYDMYGNVYEWCLDWYGPLPGGNQTDPTGPATSAPLTGKVMRGGAYDYPASSCRSASRNFRFELFPDSDLGFRVVLVTEP